MDLVKPTELDLPRQVGEKQAPNVLVAGVSVRAIAESYLRAGFRCVAFDKFADLDLRRACGPRTPVVLGHWDQLLGEVSRYPRLPWTYTGPLENYPEVVELVSRGRPLWGTSAASLRTARDPAKLAEVLADHAVPFPMTCWAGRAFGETESSSVKWIMKSLGAAGGGHVRALPHVHSLADALHFSRSVPQQIVQAQIMGRSVSAVFSSRKNRIHYHGMTYQYHSKDMAHDHSVPRGRPWQYVGSIGPIPHADDIQQEWNRIGQTIAASCGVRGVFGVDAILRDANHSPRLIPLEVNPRYTASVEVIERATGQFLMAEHVDCFSNHPRHSPWHEQITSKPDMLNDGKPKETDLLVAKGILYARQTVRFQEKHLLEIDRWNARQAWPVVSDIPMANTVIEMGDPLLTCFAHGTHLEEVARQLGIHGSGLLQQVEALCGLPP